MCELNPVWVLCRRESYRYTVWTRRLNQYSISDFFQLILGSGSCLIDQNLLFTDHTSSMTELYNLMKRRFCWSVQNWLWHDRNIKRWTRRSWRPKSYRRKIKSHKLYYYTQFTMACFKMDKRGFLLLSRGENFFFAKYGLQIAASSPFFKLKNIKKIPASKCDGFICTLQINSTYFSVLLCLKCFRVCCRFLRKPAPYNDRTM